MNLQMVTWLHGHVVVVQAGHSGGFQMGRHTILHKESLKRKLLANQFPILRPCEFNYLFSLPLN